MSHNVRMLRPKLVAVLLCSVVLALSGCGPQKVVGGKPGPMVRRIVSLSPSTSDIIARSGFPEGIVGRTASCKLPMIAPAEVVCDVKPSYEKIIALKPDLIVFDGSLFGPTETQKIESLGFKTFNYEPANFDEMVTSLYRLGTAVGKETKIAKYVTKLENQMDYLRSDPIQHKKRVAILIGTPSTGYMIAGTGSFQLNLVEIAGGIPIGPKAPNFVNLNLEQLIADDPELIFTTGESKGILGDARLKGITAVKLKRVIDVNPDVLLRAGYDVDTWLKELHTFLVAAAEGSN